MMRPEPNFICCCPICMQGGLDAPPAAPDTGQDAPEAPVAVRDSFAYSATETGGVYDGNSLLGNDTSPAGTTVTHVNGISVGASPGRWFSLNWGDVFVNPNGAIDFTAAGEFDDLSLGQSRTVYFTYTISDGVESDTNTAAITVNGTVPASFEAVDDAYSYSHVETGGYYDGPNLLANDSGSGLSITKVNGEDIGGGGWVTLSKGEIYVNSDGNIDYDALDAFDGLAIGAQETVSFTYQVTNDSNVTELATVTLTVENYGPDGEGYGAAPFRTFDDMAADQNINGQLSGNAWDDPDPADPGFDLTYSFPEDLSDYPDLAADTHDYVQAFSLEQRGWAEFWLDRYASVVPVSFTKLDGPEGSATAASEATLKFINSSDPESAYANYPLQSSLGGDAFFGNGPLTPDYGDYDFFTIGHELGHQMGLSHGHEADGGFGTMTANRDGREFSIMTYRDYIGGGTSYGIASDSAPQSLMMYDIAALQFMYGANHAHHGGDTVYSFDPASGEMFVNGTGQGHSNGKIFRTIWDGDGIDTYDFSNLGRAVWVDLAPGGWSDLAWNSLDQRANLNGGAASITGYEDHARAHVFNALLHENDTRSLIEDAIGSTGDDSLRGNIAANILQGGAGADTLSGLANADTLYGGEGVDLLLGGSEDDLLDGGTGLDTLNGGTGTDTASYATHLGTVEADLTAGTAYLDGDPNQAESLLSIENLIASEGGGVLRGSALANRLQGGGSADTLEGRAGADLLYGDGGADHLSGHEDADTLQGQAGHDTLDGGGQTDTLYGGDGNDLLSGAYGADELFGGRGNDRLLAGGGADLLNGGNNNDSLQGQDGNDTLGGGSGADRLYGGKHDDVLEGGFGNDRLYGGAGNDTLRGEGNNDLLLGGTGQDRLDGGNGDDTLTGGSGADTFVFEADQGADIVTDFSAADGEKIDLSAVTEITGFWDLLNNHLFDSDGTAQITLGSGSITLTGLEKADFGFAAAYSAEDFIFA